MLLHTITPQTLLYTAKEDNYIAKKALNLNVVGQIYLQTSYGYGYWKRFVLVSEEDNCDGNVDGGEVVSLDTICYKQCNYKIVFTECVADT